jgi:hypothetical protein
MHIGMVSRVTLSALVGLGVVVATGSAPAEANRYEQYRRQVEKRLLLLEEVSRRRGLRTSHQFHYDTIRGDRTSSYTLNLDRGTTYTIVGVCDDDCRDLDLTVVDDNGNVIDRDRSDDPVPVVTVRPKWSARFRITLSMEDCGTRDCVVGVGVFAD